MSSSNTGERCWIFGGGGTTGATMSTDFIVNGGGAVVIARASLESPEDIGKKIGGSDRVAASRRSAIQRKRGMLASTIATMTNSATTPVVIRLY